METGVLTAWSLAKVKSYYALLLKEYLFIFKFMGNTFLWNRYKQKKEMEHRLSEMKSAVESGEADDERVREYYLLHLRRWIGISLEEIESIDQEMKILRGKDSSKEVRLVTAYIVQKAAVRNLNVL